ncbi:uncharacterized protein LAESUDRAFT_717773 [Laetiporus sulphureus 93-53]|uniref:Uncharacterized protein n=1 Tax=Laetiporus sulphureus 93-53 TaxID=1314785 RepID=A0A165BFU5_9APHY|nr:uncharacterized protein LAESUDRAFT_717773 [Laetiporus sulphureus 93-53]KZT00968.1 hypothetical protein LAESUDRAFT_717773 [Laetiporus sulphureus 93-53]
MTLPTGRYIIRNAYFSTLVTLRSADVDARLMCTAHGDDEGRIVSWLKLSFMVWLLSTCIAKWDIELLDNKRHHLGGAAEQVVAAEHEHQWIIQKEAAERQYTISPTDQDTFWGFSSEEEGTPAALIQSKVTLTSPYTDERNQWVLESA